MIVSLASISAFSILSIDGDLPVIISGSFSTIRACAAPINTATMLSRSLKWLSFESEFSLT